MISTTHFLKFGCFTLISRVGESPITFSIEGEGEISVNPLTPHMAKYRAPNSLKAGKAIIKSLDNQGVEESITIYYGSHLHVIADIISNQLSIPSGDMVLEWEDFKVPKDGRTMFYIGTQTTSGVGNNSFFNGDSDAQYLSLQDSVNIQVMGIGQQVQRKSTLIMMALKSSYARKQCELNNIKISSIPTSMTNVSQAEGPGPLKRFVGVFNVFYNDFINKEVAIYDNFQTVFKQEP